MKKLVFFLVIGMLLLSTAVFAQTTQGANTQNAQGTGSENFARGGYDGPVLETVRIEDLLTIAPARPNAWVIVEGYLIQQRVPGTFILADAPQNSSISVVVHVNPYFWANLDIAANTPVLVYGTVNFSELRIEIEASRIEIPQ